MTRLQVELAKNKKRIVKVALKMFPTTEDVTVHIQDSKVMQVVLWEGGDITYYNFDLRGTTKQVIQQIKAGALIN